MNRLLAALPVEAQERLRPQAQAEWAPPMLATLTEDRFSDPGWLYERKLDGERCLIYRTSDVAELYSRNRKELNNSYPELVDAIAAQQGEFVADGEIIAFQGNNTSFARLQRRMQVSDPNAAQRNTNGEDYWKHACRQGWEGVIGGYTDPQGTRTGFGALLIGYYEEGELRYAGKVGTGYDRQTLTQLGQKLETLERDEPAFTSGKLPHVRVHWVEPRLVAQVAFSEWTRDGQLRHPRFQGLRRDKAPHDIVRERPR